MSIYKVFLIIFLVHLVLVIGAVYHELFAEEGAGLIWILFLLLDFPLSCLFFMVNSIVHWILGSILLRFTFATAIFFQIVGTVNWLLIYLAINWLNKIFR